ncbi:MAG: response regulator [bacterium]|nr:response regulator [bacterium]
MTAKEKILIMEDERPLANALGFKFKAAGFSVDVAYDGTEGSEKLKAGSCDMLLLDLSMPKKDGFAVLEEMRAAGVKTPVIALTNLSQKEDLDRVKSYDIADYLVKSDVALKDVVERVQTFFGKSSGKTATA